MVIIKKIWHYKFFKKLFHVLNSLDLYLLKIDRLCGNIYSCSSHTQNKYFKKINITNLPNRNYKIKFK